MLLLGAGWAVTYATHGPDSLKHLLEGLMAFLSLLLLLVILENAERRAEELRRARGLRDEV